MQNERAVKTAELGAEFHVFIIWEKARGHEKIILEDLGSRFEIISVLDIQWSDSCVSSNFTRFYGKNLPRGSFKETHCGSGSFLVIIVVDRRPQYESRRTSKGERKVNANTFDAKSLYRDWVGGGHRIHATDSESEARHNVAMLLGVSLDEFLVGQPLAWDGKVQKLSTDLAGASGWTSLRQLFMVLNETVSYLVMRNYEWLPDRFSTKDHGDIDLLTSSLEEMVFVTNARKVFPEEQRVHYAVQIDQQEVRFDFRHVGDDYYHVLWQREMLATRKLDGRGFYIPASEHYFYSLLYHALVHKPVIGRDYIERLAFLAEELGIPISRDVLGRVTTAKPILDAFMLGREYGYRRAFDRSVYFNMAFISDIADSKGSRELDAELQLRQQFFMFKKIAMEALQAVKDLSLSSEDLFYELERRGGQNWLAYYNYYFSPVRSYLLRPLEANLHGKRVLELGGEAGALSRYLGELGATVTMVEGDGQLAEIAESRCRDLQNVKVISQTISDFVTDERFEVVTLIGQLSNCRTIFPGPDSIGALLNRAHSFLADDGVLIVAIENKLGLKYWAGAPEDHIGVPFYGIEGLYSDSTAVTFGRQELKRLLVNSGFPDVEFYFPYPGYKIPTTILAEEIELCDPAIAINLLSPMSAPNQTVNYGRTFSEGAAYRSIIENGLLGDLANSFLVMAKKENHDWPRNTQNLAFVYSSGRARQFTKEVKLQRSLTGISVKRRLLYASSITEFLRFPEEEVLQSGELLFNSLLPVMNRKGWGALDIARWYTPLFDQLFVASTVGEDGIRRVEAVFLDASPFNFIQNEGNYSFIDLEWDDGTQLEFWFPVFRGLYYSLLKVGTVARPVESTPLRIVELVIKVIQALGGVDVDVEALMEKEVSFLERVIKDKPSVSGMVVASLHVRGDASMYFSEPSAGSAEIEETLERWLERRKPTENNLRLVTETLDSYDGGATFGIFILDLEGNLDAVIASIKSLDAERSFYRKTRLVVLTLHDIPTEHSSDELRFVKVNSQNFVEILNQKALGTTCDWFMLIEAGETFTATGLQTLALELLEASDCHAVYGDELHRQVDASLSSWFRPAFNLDYLLSYPAAMSRHWFFRRDVFIAQDGFDPRFPQSFELDLILRLVEAGGMAGLAHVDEAILITDAPRTFGNVDEQEVLLRHLQARGYEHASVSSSSPGLYRIDYGHQVTPAVSILIPLDAPLGKLQRCLETLLEHTNYALYEVRLIAGHDCPADIADWADKVAAISGGRIRVFECGQAANASVMYNAAAAEVGGEYLVILSGDVEFVRGDWLTEMLNHAQRPEVGVVGGKIFHPSGPVRHAGIVLGLRGPAGGAFVGEAADASGYMNRLQVVQNYSAVSRACMMVSRSVFAKVDGLDTVDLASGFADVDFCLKVQAAGYLAVWTPYAAMCQGIESGEEKAADNHQKQLETERRALYEKWLPQLARDPAYNQNLSLDGFGFTPAYRKAREWNLIGPSALPRILCHPSDGNGCGHYRLHQPFFAMERDMLIHGMSTDKLMAPVELERFSPDSIIYQRQFTPNGLLMREESNIYKDVFRVMDMDDFIPGVPEKSIHYNQIPKNVMAYISKALSLVDRFVVSTAPLAEAFAGLHPDIRIVQNRLPVEWWGNLESQRRIGRKPRIGWAGGTSHTGDLELLFDVVRTLSNDVEWVFFGMCPDILRPYIHEFHQGVPIEKYPERLASLNLDLALAPLEMNMFNECKSNLRLLEYGACGFPVICTDIVTYRCGMPVTLVKNRTEDWLEAIRMHLSDLDASAKAGDALREVVMRDWMLQGDALLEWRNAWLPS